MERTRAQIKTAAAPAVVGKKQTTTHETFAAGRRSGAAAVSKPSVQRERASAASSSSRGNARFMAPTASSRMAAAAKQTADEQRSAAARSARAKTVSRRATPVSSASTAVSSSAAKDDFQDLQALLARHNKKFKATHTYQPPQHSVRDVRTVRSPYSYLSKLYVFCSACLLVADLFCSVCQSAVGEEDATVVLRLVAGGPRCGEQRDRRVGEEGARRQQRVRGVFALT